MTGPSRQQTFTQSSSAIDQYQKIISLNDSRKRVLESGRIDQGITESIQQPFENTAHNLFEDMAN
jgi:hypothetical protein